MSQCISTPATCSQPNRARAASASRCLVFASPMSMHWQSKQTNTEHIIIIIACSCLLRSSVAECHSSLSQFQQTPTHHNSFSSTDTNTNNNDCSKESPPRHPHHRRIEQCQCLRRSIHHNRTSVHLATSLRKQHGRSTRVYDILPTTTRRRRQRHQQTNHGHSTNTQSNANTQKPSSQRRHLLPPRLRGIHRHRPRTTQQSTSSNYLSPLRYHQVLRLHFGFYPRQSHITSTV